MMSIVNSGDDSGRRRRLEMMAGNSLELVAASGSDWSWWRSVIHGDRIYAFHNNRPKILGQTMGQLWAKIRANKRLKMRPTIYEP